MMVGGAQLSVTPHAGVGTTLSNATMQGGIQLHNGFSSGYLTVQGAAFSVGADAAIDLWASSLPYVALADNTFNSATRRFVSAGSDLSASIPASPANFQIVGGAISPLPTNSPDTDADHWLGL
jgi:hypothetical protein